MSRDQFGPFTLQPATLPRPMRPFFQLFAVVLAGWLNRHQQRVLEHLQEENRILRRQVRGRRLGLTDDDRRRLAVRGHALGRKLLGEFASLVTPETILRRHRRLIAQKWTFLARRVDRRAVMQTIADLAVRRARDNPTWGYERIVGALAHLRIRHRTTKTAGDRRFGHDRAFAPYAVSGVVAALVVVVFTIFLHT